MILANMSDTPLKIKKGDSIAQLVLEKYENAEVEEVTFGSLDITARGSRGFGSTTA